MTFCLRPGARPYNTDLDDQDFLPLASIIKFITHFRCSGPIRPADLFGSKHRPIEEIIKKLQQPKGLNMGHNLGLKG